METISTHFDELIQRTLYIKTMKNALNFLRVPIPKGIIMQ